MLLIQNVFHTTHDSFYTGYKKISCIGLKVCMTNIFLPQDTIILLAR